MVVTSVARHINFVPQSLSQARCQSSTPVILIVDYHLAYCNCNFECSVVMSRVDEIVPIRWVSRTDLVQSLADIAE